MTKSSVHTAIIAAKEQISELRFNLLFEEFTDEIPRRSCTEAHFLTAVALLEQAAQTMTLMAHASRDDIPDSIISPTGSP